MAALFAYSLRQDPALQERAWEESRRRQFLLDPGVARPLSVDALVWGAVELPGARPDEAGRADLRELLEAFDALSDPPAGVRVAALSVDEGADDEHAPWVLGGGVSTRPSTREELGWPFLGWDVVESGCLSGLMNFGYCWENELDRELAQRFAPRLNKHGLFDELEVARDFLRANDERVGEEGPFYVCGLQVGSLAQARALTRSWRQSPSSPGAAGRLGRCGP